MPMDQTATVDAGHHPLDTATAGRCRRLLLGMFLLTLVACSPAPDNNPAVGVNLAQDGSAPGVAQGAAEERVLNFSNWVDYMPEGMLEEFERETGIKVNYRCRTSRT